DGVWGHRKRAGAKRRALDGPPVSLVGGRARERASWPTGSGGIGSAQARSAEHWTGPQNRGGRARERASWPTGSGGIGSAQARSAEHWTGPQNRGGRARERASWPTGSGGIGSAQARSAEHWTGPQNQWSAPPPSDTMPAG